MKPIQVGDLVMVVKPSVCCGSTKAIGYTFKVSGIAAGIMNFCKHCDKVFVSTVAEDGIVVAGRKHCLSVSRLIRIDPPATGDSLPTREELTA